MTRLELLRRAKAQIDKHLESKRAESSDVSSDVEATKLALMLESNAAIADAVRENALSKESLAEIVSEAVGKIKLEAPSVSVTTPEVVIPEIKIPEIRMPEIVVPEPKVTVNVPEIKIPEIKIPPIVVPETKVQMPEEMRVIGSFDEYNSDNPMSVQLRDAQGRPLNLLEGLSQVLGGSSGPRYVKINNTDSEPIPISGTISASFSADFGNGEVGAETLRVVQATDAISSVNIVGGSISTSPYGTYYASDAVGSVNVIQSVPIDVQQISGHNWSTYITGANGTIGVVTINPDGNPVYGGSSGGGLTDTELRATSVPVSQVSGSIWSTSIIDAFGSTAVGSVFNADNRIRVSVETGGSGLTDSELRASSVPVAQVSGVMWSVSVVDVYGTTATNLVNPDNRLKVELPSGASGLTDTELRAAHLDVQQVSGATDSVNVVATVGLTDTQLRATSVPVEQVSGSTWSTSVLSMPAVVVTSITNTTATNIVDSTGVAYSGSNPFPVELVDPAGNILDIHKSGDNYVSAQDYGVMVTGIVNTSSANDYFRPLHMTDVLEDGKNSSQITLTTEASLSAYDSDAQTWNRVRTNSGYAGPGVLRVTQATDVGTSVSATQVGTWNVNTVTSITNSTSSALVDSTGVQYSGSNPLPVYDGPRSTSTFAPTNATSTAYERNRVAKASAGILYGISGYNSSTAAQFILVHDASSQPADGTAAAIVIRVPASSNFSYDPGRLGRSFGTGITVTNSTTSPTKTVGYADCFFDIQYG